MLTYTVTSFIGISIAWFLLISRVLTREKINLIHICYIAVSIFYFLIIGGFSISMHKKVVEVSYQALDYFIYSSLFALPLVYTGSRFVLKFQETKQDDPFNPILWGWAVISFIIALAALYFFVMAGIELSPPVS